MIAVAMRVVVLAVVLALVVMVMGVLGGKYESCRNVLRSPMHEAKGHTVFLIIPTKKIKRFQIEPFINPNKRFLRTVRCVIHNSRYSSSAV